MGLSLGAHGCMERKRLAAQLRRSSGRQKAPPLISLSVRSLAASGAGMAAAGS
jgi:hypothetical protein